MGMRATLLQAKKVRVHRIFFYVKKSMQNKGLFCRVFYIHFAKKVRVHRKRHFLRVDLCNVHVYFLYTFWRFVYFLYTLDNY
jgi:hypothetical protein